MTKTEAVELMKENLQTQNLIDHSFAVGAIMKVLAEKQEKDHERWEITGILHDLDYEFTKDNPDIHALKTVEMLDGKIDEEMKGAILAHNDKKPLENEIDISLYAADPLSGFLTAAILVIPSKSASDLKVSSLKKKFKDKAFARGANRDNMMQIEKLGITLEELFELGIKAMQNLDQEV